MRLPRVQFTVRRTMILMVFVAIVSALVTQSMRVARRDRELARLRQSLADYRWAADRTQWAERMYQKGYVSKAQVESEKLALRRARDSLGIQN